ncbi:calnexin-like protein [Elysia marginata]|uniref:Calnexin-like protein n=1 Tax=Elysia marginata TaxID=1093978 RepID=A0AAV4JE06_9GAST|nr:calnexin-like protein [Elysia marginata]
MKMKIKLIFVLAVALVIVTPISTHADDTFENVEEDDDVEDGTVETEEEDEILVPKAEYQRPIPTGDTHFHEPFDTRAEFLKRWVQSQAKKDGAEDDVAKYDGIWDINEPRDSLIRNDLGLILKSKAKHHAISAKLDKPFMFDGKPFIVQYEVKFENGMDCGGAYIKLLSKSDKLNLKMLTDKTPYTIMFGPDKCGNDHKLHFIFRHKHPKTGEFEEKHAERPTAKLETYFTDRKTHLYTLIVNPDNSYEMKVDNTVVSSGSLLENFSPPVNPPKEIDDPNDKKPADWDEREKDDEMDGEWEAPRVDNPACKDAPGCGPWEKPSIPNPNYKGIWKPPMIDNPDYKGQWAPRRIPNPNYFEDDNPYKMTPINAVGLELWSMTDNIVFDNFIIADNFSVVDDFTAITWEMKNLQERAADSAGSWWHALKSSAEERPWLWGVYLVVLLLPVVLLSVWLCPRAGPVKPEDIDAHKKKFDDPSPDTIEEEEEEEAEEAAAKEEEVDEEKDTKAGGDGIEDDNEGAESEEKKVMPLDPQKNQTVLEKERPERSRSCHNNDDSQVE